MTRQKSNYDGLEEVNEQRLIGLFFCNVDDTITDEQKKIEQLKRVRERLLHCMFVPETTNTYHYLYKKGGIMASHNYLLLLFILVSAAVVNHCIHFITIFIFPFLIVELIILEAMITEFSKILLIFP